MKNIFISSTFRDMQAERDMVQERVLPALREEARKYGDSVGVIDLRWGVDTFSLETEEGAAKVLKVCLDEIDRSHPYMLIFIGERYGWIPESKLIETAVYGREDKYITDDYAKSVTALEIEYGALSEKYGELDHCVICFREPIGNILDDAEKGVYVEQTEEGRRKLELLKEKIKQDLGDEERLITYSGTWDKSALQLVDFTSDGQPLENVLVNSFVKMFRDDWKEYENLSWQDKEQLAFRALMESKLHSFVGRKALLEEYYQSAVNGTCPIILQGEVGSGKTAIMCKLIERLQKEGKNVFMFFSGAGDMSTNATLLVKQMVYYMENLLGTEKHFGEDEETVKKDIDVMDSDVKTGLLYTDWIARMKELDAHLPEGEKVYVCIDALDQLFFDEHVEKLDFFIKGTNIRILASCTDSFKLPTEVLVGKGVKQIPLLSGEDAKLVAESILASYSRNAYSAIELEILKKKNIGSPLYISLLIQRLNMMDEEELRMARTEEEIIRLGIKNIQDMPDDLEDAIVSIIRNGINKVSDNKDILLDVIYYLAISRKGLRMEDLRGILSMQNKEFPTLDVTLLIKYLDTFFYMHEDDRIDFTHKVIRQGLIKNINDQEDREELVKEYLKKLNMHDSVRIQEGMYFARIRQDEEFASQMLGQAGVPGILKEEERRKVIKDEATADGGRFYCQMIKREEEFDLIEAISDLFLWKILDQFNFSKEEMMTRVAISEAVVARKEAFYEKWKMDSRLWDLIAAYVQMGNVLKKLGRVAEALSYYENGLKYSEIFYKKQDDLKSLQCLMISYNKIGCCFYELGNEKEAYPYNEKSLYYAERLNEKEISESNLRRLSVSYINIGQTLTGLGRIQEALQKCEKGLEYAEILHEKYRSDYSSRTLADNYSAKGKILEESGQMEEGLLYYEKARKIKEELFNKQGNEKNLEDLLSCYLSIQNVLWKLDKENELLLICRKLLEWSEILHKSQQREDSCRRVFVSYYNLGRVLELSKQLEEAVSCYINGVIYSEELYEQLKDEKSLTELLEIYNRVANGLCDLCRDSEAMIYYKKLLDRREECYRLNPNEMNLRNVSIAYNNYGLTLCETGNAKDAMDCLEKALQQMAELHKNNSSQYSVIGVGNYKRNYAKALLMDNHLSEALQTIEESIEIVRAAYAQKVTNVSKKRLMKTMLVYAEILLANNQVQESYDIYMELLEYFKSKYVENGIPYNAKNYIDVLKGILLCLHKLERDVEAEEYIILAKEEAGKLFGGGN